MAPLQKRALISLLTGLTMTIALIAAIVIKRDITAFTDEGLRYFVYAVLIGVPLVYLILVNLTLRKPTQIDERDRLIQIKAGRTQWLAVILSLAAWMIILTEAFRKTGEIPTVFLTLIFISILIIGTLAQSLGILLEYWRMEKDG